MLSCAPAENSVKKIRVHQSLQIYVALQSQYNRPPPFFILTDLKMECISFPGMNSSILILHLCFVRFFMMTNGNDKMSIM